MKTGANQFSNIVWIDETGNKRCCDCQEYKPLDQFSKDLTAVWGVGYSCKTCAAARSRANYAARKHDSEFKKNQRKRWIKSRHGITSDEYDYKLHNQDFKCKICETYLLKHKHFCHLDHDHNTGKLRDFLCTNCNRALGHFMDSKSLLLKAANYLEQHKALDKMLSEGSCP